MAPKTGDARRIADDVLTAAITAQRHSRKMLNYSIDQIPAIAVKGSDTRRCIGCGELSSLDIIEVPGDPGAQRKFFNYAHCPNCGTLSIVLVPDDLGEYYSGSYYSFAKARKSKGIKALLKRVRDSASIDPSPLAVLIRKASVHVGIVSLRPLFDGTVGKRFDKSSSILDVGCGFGQKLLDLKSVGFSDLTGIDPFMTTTHAEPGLRLMREPVENLRSTFDIVMFHHSFEHTVNPETTLRAVRNLLNPDGMLVIRVPVAATWAWREFGGEWSQMDAPRHITLFSRVGFTAIAKRKGFAVVHTAFDSGTLQITGSLLRQKGINVHERSGRVDDSFSKDERRSFAKRAIDLNRRADGDQATFFLKVTGDLKPKPN